MFDFKKKTQWEKADNSKKGKIDREIAPLIEIINSKKDFYTTSSCAGRIVLLVEPESAKKKDFSWLYVSHSKGEFKKINEILKNPPKEMVWLRMEPFIIHICARNLKAADKFLDLLRSCGLKHSGILAAKKRIIVEVNGNDRMDAPVCADECSLIDEDYLNILVNEANRKLKKNRQRLERLKKSLEDFIP